MSLITMILVLSTIPFSPFGHPMLWAIAWCGILTNYWWMWKLPKRSVSISETYLQLSNVTIVHVMTVVRISHWHFRTWKFHFTSTVITHQTCLHWWVQTWASVSDCPNPNIVTHEMFNLHWYSSLAWLSWK